MSVTEPGPPGSASLAARAQAIVLTPGPEWDKIDVETATTQGLFTGYVCILAAIGPVAGAVGSIVFGHSFLGVTYRPPIAATIVGAVVGYLLSLVAVYVLGLVIDALAPSFDGHKSQIQAMKIAAYSGTAGWIAGAFAIIPSLAPLAALGGLYNLYLLYVGMPKLMKAPQEKALGYTVVTILVALLLYFVVGVVGGAVIGAAGGFSHLGALGVSSNDGGTLSGAARVGGTSIDLGKLAAASKQMEAAASSMQAQQNGQPGSIKAVPAETLKAMLPAALPAGFTRTESEATSGGVAGVSGSSAQGVYARGDQKITLQLTDMAAMGALAALGGAVDVQQDKETSTGYEKLGKVDGRLTTEAFDRQSKIGKYSVVVASRFLVEADGQGVEIDDLKGAVSSVGIDRLEVMAHG